MSEALIGGLPIEDVRRRVGWAARKYRGISGIEIEDLEQTGWIGVMKAVSSYREGCGTEMLSWITMSVLGEIKHYVRDRIGVLNGPREKGKVTRRVQVRSLERMRAKRDSAAEGSRRGRWEPAVLTDYGVVDVAVDVLAAQRRLESGLDRIGRSKRRAKGSVVKMVALRAQGLSDREVGSRVGLSQRGVNGRIHALAREMGRDYGETA